MAETPTLGEITAAIATMDNWQDLMQIKDALDKRVLALPPFRYNAAQVRAKYRKGMRVLITGLNETAVNGHEAEIVEVAQTRLVVDIFGVSAAGPYRMRIPATSAVIIAPE